MDHPPRIYCYRCRKPDLLCICADVTPVPTRFGIVILQHPQESRRTISTARIVSLSLTGARLFVGLDFAGCTALHSHLAAAPGPVYLVYPERGALDVVDVMAREHGWPDGAPTFVIIDGTWAQARKIKNQNPCLDRFERVSLSPGAPSRYRIRRQPRGHYLSTVEASVLLLSRLEGSEEAFRPLLEVFDRMIDRQLSFKSGESRRGVRRPAPRPEGG
ncbi:MAG: DTW domain-containing protein [Candidatus Riflebacteria bacterium]|nr:DTW domain-containing protein [Candidatus Riflebacteria bacterium]